jgi:starvation-inducible DNA-binding protein
MLNKETNNTYEVEYKRPEKAAIITPLNELLANYQIYYHKLRIFRWNVVGKDYFDLRNQLMNLQKKAGRNIDEIAERIRIYDQTPMSMLSEYIKSSEIKENQINLSGYEMVKEILRDLLALLKLQEQCMKATLGLHDYGTEKMLRNFIYEMEKDHKILLSWIK